MYPSRFFETSHFHCCTKEPPGANLFRSLLCRCTLCALFSSTHTPRRVRSFVRSFVGASHEIAREVTDDGPETETRRNEPTGREINNTEKGGE